MAWVRIDDGMPLHPKVVGVGAEAAWWFVSALCYANRYLTDGVIPVAAVPMIARVDNTQESVSRLVAAGLLTETSDGYVIHDYLEYQPSSAKVKTGREASAARMAQARKIVTETRMPQRNEEPFAQSSSEQVANNSQTDENVRANNMRPNPNPNPKPNPKPRERETGEPEGFAEFWNAYPVKKARPAAAAAWRKKRLTADDAPRLIAAVKRQENQWTDPKYIPHPATWLNNERWHDETVEIRPTNGSSNPFLSLLQEEAHEPHGNYEDSGYSSFAIPEDGDY